jgi:hypothetical protein
VVLRAAEKLHAYVQHRAEREGEILAALAVGPQPVAALVATVYAAYPVEVHSLAERSVLAHLLKLQAEGRVGHRGRGPGAEWFVVTPRACARCGRPVQGRARYCSSCSLILLQEGSAAEG